MHASMLLQTKLLSVASITGPEVASFCSEIQENTASPSGNRTPVSRVTGGDTYHYTNEDLLPARAVFKNPTPELSTWQVGYQT